MTRYIKNLLITDLIGKQTEIMLCVENLILAVVMI